MSNEKRWQRTLEQQKPTIILGYKGRRIDNRGPEKKSWWLTINATKWTSAVKPEAKPSDLALGVGAGGSWESSAGTLSVRGTG